MSRTEDRELPSPPPPDPRRPIIIDGIVSPSTDLDTGNPPNSGSGIPKPPPKTDPKSE
jgi:hypothetical protein